MRPVFLGLLFLFSLVALKARQKPPKTYSIPTPPQADFSALDWLVGEWSGKTVAPSPSGQVRLSVTYDLDKQFMIFREELTLQASPRVPATNESWLGILSGRGPGSGYVLRTFSSTGFVIWYRAGADQAEVTFTPEGGEQPPPGWLFRRVMARTGVAELTETVQAAPPNESFFDYYTAKLTHSAVSPSASTTAGETPKHK